MINYNATPSKDGMSVEVSYVSSSLSLRAYESHSIWSPVLSQSSSIYRGTTQLVDDAWHTYYTSMHRLWSDMVNYTSISVNGLPDYSKAYQMVLDINERGIITYEKSPRYEMPTSGFTGYLSPGTNKVAVVTHPVLTISTVGSSQLVTDTVQAMQAYVDATWNYQQQTPDYQPGVDAAIAAQQAAADAAAANLAAIQAAQAANQYAQLTSWLNSLRAVGGL